MTATKNPASRHYLRRMAIATSAYLVAFFMAVIFIPDDAEPQLVYVVLGLLPGIATLAFIWAMGRLLIELDDEYLRMLEIRKFIVATGLTLSVASVWGLLELMVNVPALPVFWVFPGWCLGLAIGQLYNRITLGVRGTC